MCHGIVSSTKLILMGIIVGVLFIPGFIFSQGIVIDHTCTDITQIPDMWVNQVKSQLKIHYAHTSHGEQITVGMERLSDANSKYAYYPDNCSMPQTASYVSLMDGQYYDGYCETYCTPEWYWQDNGLNITRSVLNGFDINISLWAWCTQLDYFSQMEAQEYLDAMVTLESEYPNVTFIYFTGNAQSVEQNRYNRNNQIRNYCQTNGKILFDFADLDCWYNGEQHFEGGIPTEHPHYNGDEAGHTTYESCENKAKAFWWLLARVTGWEGTAGGGTYPSIHLDRNQLNFSYTIGGTAPPSQSFGVSNSGVGTLNWSVSDDMSWLACAPTSGTDSGTVAVSVDVSGLGVGTHSGTITISSSNAGNSPQTISVTLTVAASGTDYPPFGYFDSPLDGATVRSSIPVTGWALDDIGVESVKIYRQSGSGNVYIGDGVLVEGARPDVAAAWPQYPNNTKAGWGYMMLTNFLPNGGNGTFVIEAIVTDTAGHSVSLGTKTIYCDNENAVKPFGAIDTPLQGGTASGDSYVNWGWVLTPQPASIPTDGSTINVWVDGVNLGHPNYNIYRTDIATLFPGYANSNGAVGYFLLDTTAYSNGVHTIHWTAQDSDGNKDGIGSRYFSISNSEDILDRRMSGGVQEKRPLTPFAGDLSMAPIRCTDGVEIHKGYNDEKPMQRINANSEGWVSIGLKSMERVVIKWVDAGSGNSTFWGGVLSADGVKPLPIGSFLDSQTGIFYWQPGPGFRGNFHLVLIEDSGGKLSKQLVRIEIAAKQF